MGFVAKTGSTIPPLSVTAAMLCRMPVGFAELSSCSIRVPLAESCGGLFRRRRRLKSTERVLKFQYASSTNGTTRETISNVKFLYQIT